MKKLILSAILLAVAAFGFAQTPPAQPAGEKSEWLPTFTSITVNAPLDITFIRVAATEAPKLVYDTKGSYTTKFKAEVKDKVLQISERSDSRRPERTSVTVYYNDVQSISVSDAVATFEGTLSGAMFDLKIGGRASVTAALDLKDLVIDLSGQSAAKLSGKVRYFSATVSSGRVDGSELVVTSAQINASNGGSAVVEVSERFDGTTSLKGNIHYKGTPEIVRSAVKFMGGEIAPAVL